MPARLILCLLFLFGGAMHAANSSSTPIIAAEAASHVTDPARLLQELPLAVPSLESRLTRFEHESGVKILVQFHAKSPAPEEDAKPGVFMHALATELRVARGGVLAVYFADEDDWRIWIGDDLTAKFAGRPGTVEELTASDAIHNAKEAFFAAAQARSDAAFAAEGTPTATLKLKGHADEIVRGLIQAFGSE